MKKFTDNYSSGCKACQNGRWLCIFLTYLCNSACTFCAAPFRNRDLIQTSFGSDPNIILDYLERIPFQGISFSGGESFLVYDRMLTWLDFFKRHKPELYYWAYTNGINIKKEQLIKLKEYGLNELRFNIAASGYYNKSVLKTISSAKEIFDHVAVEIPSIPEDFEKLMKTLPALEKSGVDYLNLHEYILVPCDPASKNAPKGSFLMNYEMEVEYHQQSLSNTCRIKKICRENAYKLKVNNCSLCKKESQMRGRRLTMGYLLKEGHEKLTDDGFLQTIYVYKGTPHSLNETIKNYHLIDKSLLVHPDKYIKAENQAYLLTVLPALSISALPKVLNFKKI